MSWADSPFYTGWRRAGDALVPSLRRHVARPIKEFEETEPDFRPPSVAESRLFGDGMRSRAIGGDSLTMSQSSRVAQPKDASKAP